MSRIAFLGYSVDPEAGIVYGLRGKPIRKLIKGYVTVWNSRHGSFYRQAHRMVWEAVNGQIPEGMQINHKNGIKHDNRIANLELVTPLENVQHACRSGLVRRGGDLPAAVLSIEASNRLQRRRSEGLTQVQLAREFGVSTGTVSNVLSGKHWTSRRCDVRAMREVA